MKRRILRIARLSFPLASAIAAALLSAQSAHAASGTWTANASANWTDSTRWSGSTIADGAGFTANFTANISAFRTVTLNGNRTIGNITFTDSTTSSHDLAIAGANILTLDVATGSPVIDVTQNGRFLFLNSQIAGTDGLQKNGPGGLTLSGANTYTGTTTITAGRLQFATQASLYSNIDTNWTEANINVQSGASIGFTVGGTGEFTTGNITTLLNNLSVSSSATSGMNAGSIFVFNAANASGGSFTIADVIADSSGVSGGSRALSKVGTGTLVLSGPNTYTGATTLSTGTLRLENTLSVQNSSSLAIAANRLEIGTGSAFAGSPNLTMQAGTLVSDRLGAGAGLTHVLGNAQIGNGISNFIAGANVTSGTAAIQLGNVTNDNASIASPALNPTTANLIITGAVNLGAGLNAGTANFTLGGTGSVNSIAGVIVNGVRETANLIKSGTSTWTLTGDNTYNGTTTVSAGTLDLGGGTATGSLASPTLVLAGGSFNFTRTGNATQSFTTANITGVAAVPISVVAGNTLNLGTIVRGAGGSLDFSTTGPGTVAALASNNVNGMMPGLTFGNNWAVANGDGVAISGLAAYTLTSVAGTTAANYLDRNIEVNNSAGPVDAAITANSLRFISPAANTLTLATGPNTLSAGGILVGSAVGSNPSTITGGTLTGAASQGLAIIQNNSAGGLTISSTIADNTLTSVTKSGAGLLTIDAANTYTGGTTVNEGTLKLSGAGTLGLAGARVAVSSGALLDLNGTDQNIAFTAGTGVGTVANNSGSGTSILTLSLTGTAPINGGVVTIQDNTNGSSGKVAVVITANTQPMSNLNTYSGGSTVNAGAFFYLNSTSPMGAGTGVINLPASGSTTSVSSGLLVDGATYANDVSGAGYVHNNSGTASTATLTGNVNTSGNFNVRVAGGGFNFAGSGNSTLSGVIGPAGASGVFGPNTTVSGGILIKSGTGTLTLTGTNLHTGSTTVAAGILNANSTSALGSGGAGNTLIFTGGTLQAGGAIISPGTRPVTLTSTGLIDTNDFDVSIAGVMSGAGGLTKSGPGTLTLTGVNTYSGTTTVTAGTLALADNATLKFVVGAASGTNNRLTGAGTVTLDGDFVIDTSAADALASGTWTLVDNATLVESYTTNFTVAGFTPAGSTTWEKTVGAKKYSFDETSGILTLTGAAAGSYASWIAGFPGVGLLNGVNDDPDNDGIDNSTEMVLGGNPATGMDTALLPTLELVTNPTGTGPIPPGNYLLFTYRRSAVSELAMVAASCETDSDLIAPWTPAINGTSGVVIQEDTNFTFTPAAPADTDRVRVYVPRGANAKLFGRLKVVVP